MRGKGVLEVGREGCGGRVCHDVVVDEDDCGLRREDQREVLGMVMLTPVALCVPSTPAEIGDATIPLFCYLVHCCHFSREIALTAAKWMLFRHFFRIDVIWQCVNRPRRRGGGWIWRRM